jgi:phage replication O-like protein O
MANPQPDQFTKISNELMEAIPLYKFNGTQLRLLIAIIRYTYGFSRKEWELSLSFLAKSTGIHKEQVKRELKTLIDHKVVNVVREANFKTTRILAFNKNYDEWSVKKSELINTQETNTFPGSEIEHHTGSELASSPGSELDPQERYIKENIKEKKEKDKLEPEEDPTKFNFPDPFWGMVEQIDSLPQNKQLDMLVVQYGKKYPDQRKAYGIGGVATARKTFLEAIKLEVQPSEILKEILFNVLDEGEKEPSPWDVTNGLIRARGLEQTRAQIYFDMANQLERGNYNVPERDPPTH